MKRGLTLVVGLLALASLSWAQGTTIRVADSSSSGTYKKMLGELVEVCGSDDFNIVEASGVTGGAPGNLDALVNNRAEAAFLHSDVFFANWQSDPPTYGKLKTLIALYPEPIHVLALRQSRTKKNWVQTVDINTLEDARGYKVGAAGGGVFTARILQVSGGFEAVDEGSGDAVIAALKNGDIAAAIFVGAAPLPNLQSIDKNTFKLIGIGGNISDHVQGVYRPATINYPGLTNGPLKTLAPVATLLTRQFSTPAKIEAQRAMRACFIQKLDELKDAHSPNWQAIESATDPGTLNNYLVLPDKTTAPKAQKATAARR